MRTCIACGATSDKRELVRIVRTPGGDVVCDPRGKAPGRGAYLCKDAGCFEKAAKKRLLGKHLRASVGERDYRRLEEEFAALLEDGQAALREDGE